MKINYILLFFIIFTTTKLIYADRNTRYNKQDIVNAFINNNNLLDSNALVSQTNDQTTTQKKNGGMGVRFRDLEVNWDSVVEYSMWNLLPFGMSSFASTPPFTSISPLISTLASFVSPSTLLAPLSVPSVNALGTSFGIQILQKK